MAKVCYLLLLFTSLALVPSWAQEPSQPLRLELPLDISTTQTELFPLPDSSLLLHSKIGNIWGNKATFHFDKYDQQLERVWTQVVELDPAAEYIRSFTETPYTYLVFSGKLPKSFTFVKLDTRTGEATTLEQEFENIDYIYEYGVLAGQYFIIGRNSINGNPLLLHLNPINKEFKLLPTISDNESTFSDLLVDRGNNRVDVVLTESNRRISRLQVKSFDPQGELITNHFIIQPDERSLLNAEMTPGDTTSKILLGTFGTRDLRYSQGFFSAKVSSGVAEGEFYNMLQLKNFYKYMKPRREKRVRAREASRLQAGKAPKNQFRLLLHDLITTPQGYILAAEIYYPQYKNNVSNWSPMARSSFNNRNAESYKHTQVVVLGFDKNGILQWDNSFSMQDITTYNLTHAVELAYASDGRVVVAYPDKNKVVYKVMQYDVYSDEETEVELLPYAKNEKIQNTEVAGLIPWYGPNFAAFGFQRVKAEDGNSRQVFYINKISF